MKSGLIRWAILVACFAVAVLPLIPPRPAGSEADPSQFSADRAISHVDVIGRNPHPTGSAESVLVRGYLIDALSDIGLSVETQSVEVEDYYVASGATVELVNVLAKIEGVDSTGAVTLVAHYDTVPWTPGANDDSGAVGSLIEVARILSTGPPLRNDVILLFTDGEEPAPHFGSTAFVEGHPWFDEVAYVVNLEATGSGGPSLLIEVSGSGRAVIDVYSEATPHPAAFSFVTELASLAGGFGTDFDRFREGGVPGVSFAYAHGSPIYHTEHDSIENVGRASVQQQGANTLSVARYVANADLDDEVTTEDAVFFTVVGSTVITYSIAFARAVSLVALAVLGITMVLNRRSGSVGSLRIMGAAGLVAGIFAVALVFGALMWMALVIWRPTPGVVEGYGLLAILLGSVTGIWTLAIRFFGRRFERGELAGGVVVVWTVLAVVTSWLAPGTSYLFMWPALVGLGFWMAGPTRSGSVVASLTTLLIVAGVTFIADLPAIDIFFQMAQPRPGNTDSQLIPLAGVAAGLWVLVVALVGSVTRTPHRFRVH